MAGFLVDVDIMAEGGYGKIVLFLGPFPSPKLTSATSRRLPWVH